MSKDEKEYKKPTITKVVKDSVLALAFLLAQIKNIRKRFIEEEDDEQQ